MIPATLVAVGICLSPAAALANTGVPMIGLMWPAGWLLFPVVVLAEALVARRVLRVNYRSAAVLSAKANAWSTLIGVPIAWLSWLLLWILVQDIGGLPEWSIVPLSAAFPPSRPRLPWLLSASAAVMCFPSFFLSVYIEWRVMRRAMPGAGAGRWAWGANALTYSIIVAGLATTAWLRRDPG